jgi:4-amino-4-deoxy-L-arabinose transferase-like glycosyltransferase
LLSLPLNLPSAASLATVRRQSIGLAVLALVLFTLGNVDQTTIGFDSRFMVFAQEMLRHGPSFFPTTYGEPYPDYSATSTFFVYLLSLPLGRVTSLTAWLPTAIASAVLVGLMYRLVAAYSRQWALLSVALLLLSSTFITETRAISLDQMLATVSFAVFYLGYAADHFGARRRTGLLLALLVLGFAIRGPIGVVVPTGMLCSYYLLSGQWRRMFMFGLQAVALLAVCIGVLLLLAKVSGGQDFLNEVVRMQFTSRMDGSEGKSSLFYYFSSSLGNYALAYPVAIVSLIAIALRGRQPLTPALRLVMFVAAAGLIVMVGLSIPQAKKARYMLPMVPMAAIIAAYPFQALDGRLYAWLRGLLQGLFLLTPSALIAGLLFAQHRIAEHLASIGVITSVLVLLQVIAVAVLFKAQWRAASLAACAVLALWMTFIWEYEPLERAAYDTRSFTAAVQDIIQRDPAPIALYAMPKDGKAIKFVVNFPQDLKPTFLETPTELAAVQGPVYVVIAKTVYQELPDSRLAASPVLLSSRFDKDDYLLLRLP